MSGSDDRTGVLCEQVSQAFHDRTPLVIRAGNSKSFYGRKVEGTELRLQGHEGILAYEPSELVLTARSGTPISHIEAALQELKDKGLQLIDQTPRLGAGGAKIAFLNPKATGGVLVELCQR